MTARHLVARTRCPACHGSRSRELYRCGYHEDPIRSYLLSFYGAQGGVDLSLLEGGHYILIECLDCRLVYQGEVPDDALLGVVYDQWIDASANYRREVLESPLLNREIYAKELFRLLELVGGPPGRIKVLDFGMGWGGWCQVARGFGCETYGAELSVSRLAHAERIGIPVLGWDDLPGQDLHIINTEQVFEHLIDPLDVLKHLARAVRPGGLVKISVPNGNDLERRLRSADWSADRASRRSLNAVAPLEHVNCFRSETLVEMARHAGLEEVRVPLRLQYAHRTHYPTLAGRLKELVRPVAHGLLGRGTSKVFRLPLDAPR